MQIRSRPGCGGLDFIMLGAGVEHVYSSKNGSSCLLAQVLCGRQCSTDEVCVVEVGR